MFTTEIEIYPHPDGVHCGNCPYRIGDILLCTAFRYTKYIEKRRVYRYLSPAEGDLGAIRCRECIETEKNQSFNHTKGDRTMTDSIPTDDKRRLHERFNTETGESLALQWIDPEEVALNNLYDSTHGHPFEWKRVFDSYMIAMYPRPPFSHTDFSNSN